VDIRCPCRHSNPVLPHKSHGITALPNSLSHNVRFTRRSALCSHYAQSLFVINDVMSEVGLTWPLVLQAPRATFQITVSPFHQGKHADMTIRNQRTHTFRCQQFVIAFVTNGANFQYVTLPTTSANTSWMSLSSVSQTFFKWGPLLSVRMFYGPPYCCPLWKQIV
jgi:hypothetical protein